MNPSPFSSQELYEFDLNGFVVLRNFLSPELVLKMNQIIDTSESKAVPGKFPYLHLDPIFMELMANPRTLEICEFLLGEWFRWDHAFGLHYGLSAEGSRGSDGLHAGPYANQGVFRYSWFNGRPQCGLIVFDYFLKPVEVGDGGLVLIPGSHKLNLPLTGSDVFHSILKNKLEAPWLCNPAMNAGDLLIFTEAVIHGTKQWVPAQRSRRNLHMSYSPGYQASRNPKEVEKYSALAKTEQQKRLMRVPYVLGFNDDGVALSDNDWRTKTRIVE